MEAAVPQHAHAGSAPVAAVHTPLQRPTHPGAALVQPQSQYRSTMFLADVVDTPGDEWAGSLMIQLRQTHAHACAHTLMT